MSEAGDYTVHVWSDHAMGGAAKRDYDAYAGRSYDTALRSGKTLNDLVPDKVTTRSSCPLIIVADETGSMGEWPAVIFDKLPYLNHEAKTEYLGADAEICMSAVGDAYSDDYSLQVQPFTSGKGLKDTITNLVIEANGGGQGSETYELAALYFTHNVEMPNAVKPILIFIGDEQPYNAVSPQMAWDVAKVKISRTMSSKEIFRELKARFSVYLIRKPYGRGSFGDDFDQANRRILNGWIEVLGEDRIFDLPDPSRVVDVIFGILARESDRVDYFKQEITDRQTPAQVATVYKALGIDKQLPPGKSNRTGRSVMHLPPPDDGRDAKPLI